MVRLTTRMRRILAAAAAAAVVAGITVSATGPHAGAAVNTGTAATARAGDSPPGFWWGTDSWPISISGNPYQEPKGLGRYGGYIGMTGSWSYWLSCKGGFLAWSSANSAQANSNYAHGIGIGTGAYWFMGGPGVDPHYNGTYSEALAWGQRQAVRAVADANGQAIKYKVLFMDIELPGVAPAHDNGWNSVYTSPCSGKVKTSHIAASLDRGVFNGFYGYEKAHGYTPGVYSDAVRVGLDLRHRQRGLHPRHRRVDVRAGNHQLQRGPGRLVPQGLVQLCHVLRRGDPDQRPRADVAVVRRRRPEQRDRRLRPDRRQHREVDSTVK